MLVATAGALAPQAIDVVSATSPSVGFANDTVDALRSDLRAPTGELVDTSTRKRSLKIAGGVLVATSFISEVTIGNELPSLQVADLATDTATNVSSALIGDNTTRSERVARGALTGVTTGSLVGAYVGAQQFFYGTVLRRGLEHTPQTIDHIRTLKPDSSKKTESLRHFGVTLGLGTSMALIESIRRDPDITDNGKKRAVGSSSMYLAAEWGILSGLLAGGSDSVVPQYTEQIIDVATSPSVLGAAFVGGSILYSWASLGAATAQSALKGVTRFRSNRNVASNG